MDHNLIGLQISSLLFEQTLKVPTLYAKQNYSFICLDENFIKNARRSQKKNLVAVAKLGGASRATACRWKIRRLIPISQSFLFLKEQPPAAESVLLHQLYISEALVHSCPEIIPKDNSCTRSMMFITLEMLHKERRTSVLILQLN